MQRGLAVANLSDPDPPAAWQWFFGSHPTMAQRIALAEDWDGAGEPVTRTLVVTNDFPPAAGRHPDLRRRAAGPPAAGLASSCSRPTRRVRPSTTPGCPIPSSGAPPACCCPRGRPRAPPSDLARRHGCDSAFFGAAAPLGLIAPALRAAGVGHLVGATHGHETGWVALPGSRQLLQRIAVGPGRAHLHQRVHPRPARARPRRRAPGWPSSRRASTSTGSPRTPTARASGGGTASATRRWWSACPGWSPARARTCWWPGWPRVLARHPDARLLLVGGGPAEASLRRAVAARWAWRTPSSSPVPVPAAELPAHYAAGDVFAMPCRTRRGGLDVEGLGMVFLEAAACGRPVVAGTSGGAPEAVQEGVTGHVVDPRSADAVASHDRRPARRPRPRRRRWARRGGPGSSSAGPGRRSPRRSTSCSTRTAHSTEPRPADAGRGSSG